MNAKGTTVLSFNLPHTHLGSLEEKQMVIRVILRRSGGGDPQTVSNGFQGGFDLIGYKTPFARCQQIIDIHPAESQPIQPSGHIHIQTEPGTRGSGW